MTLLQRANSCYDTDPNVFSMNKQKMIKKVIIEKQFDTIEKKITQMGKWNQFKRSRSEAIEKYIIQKRK
mgnify:CR=1 FL=1